jgi:hypothetical protein
VLDHSPGFAGLISGFAGNGTLSGSDQIDLKDINHSSPLFSETFDPLQDTLLVSDGTNSATLHFVGTYVAQNFSFAGDGGVGTIVYDPPVSPGSHGGSAGAVAGVSNEMSNGNSDGFKFASADHINLTVSHSEDLPQLGAQPFATGPAAPSQTHYEGLAGVDAQHLEAHDPITLMGIANAELNSTHFHLV